VGDKYILKRSFQSSSSALQDRRWNGESSFNKKFNSKTMSYDNRGSSFRGKFNKDNGGYDRRGDSGPPKRSRKVTDQLDGPYRVKDYEKYENKNNVDHLKPAATNALTIDDFSGDAIQSLDWQEKKSATGKSKNHIFVDMDDDDDWENEELEPEEEIKRIPPKKKSSLNEIPVFDDEGRELRGKDKVKLIEEIREDDFSDGDLDEEPKSTRFNRNMGSAGAPVDQMSAAQNKNNKNQRKMEEQQPPTKNRASTSRDSRDSRNDERYNRRTTEEEGGDRQDNRGMRRERKMTIPRLEGEEQEWVNPDRERKNNKEEEQEIERSEENDRTNNNKNNEVNAQQVLERRERRFEDNKSPSRRSGYSNNNNNNNNFERDNRDREGNNYRGASNRNPTPRRDGGGREGRVGGGTVGNFEPEYGNYEGDHLYGISPILAALRSRRRKMDQLIIQSDLDGMAEKKKDGSAVEEILRLAKDQNIEIRQFNKYLLNNLSGQRPHQGFILRAKPLEFSPLDELKDWRTETNIFSTKKP
jgi:hypothetical protein